ncbi:MAG: solute carrier family 23 protein [Syntrophobacteraceae bacterium]|jgi:NCS2 family nucleobase:cation symporter-2
MPKRPANLLYAVNEVPPVGISLILAVQHIFFLAGGLMIVTIIMHEVGSPPDLIQSIISMSMIAGGLASILQALGRGPIGSGYLCTEGIDPTFISSSILAGSAGGVSLIFGMTMISGALECLLSRIMYRLRVLFPPEVTGTVLTMVGLSLVPLMVLNFFGVKDTHSPIEGSIVAVALVTLCAMVGTNIWSKGKLKLYSIIIGMASGYLAAYLLGILSEPDLKRFSEAPLFSIPDISYLKWSFDIKLAIPIIVATLASTLKSVATLTMCQKVNDAEWTRPDLANIGRGTFADGLASLLGGMIGGLGQSLYASSVGLSVATGVTSRVIAFFTGGIFIALAFFPKLTALFTIMPRPVMGGALVFMVSFMVISGIQIITSRMIDTRRTFVIAVALMFGLSVDIFPELYRNIHPWARPLFSSSLALATVLAIVLNLIVRIGIARRARIELEPGVDSSEKIFQFMENHGAAWGARKEVIYRAISAMNELMEAASFYERQDRHVDMQVSFDEFNLDIRASYRGEVLELPAGRPDEHELCEDPKVVARLAGYLVRSFADKSKVYREGDLCKVDLHFNH